MKMTSEYELFETFHYYFCYGEIVLLQNKRVSVSLQEQGSN